MSRHHGNHGKFGNGDDLDVRVTQIAAIAAKEDQNGVSVNRRLHAQPEFTIRCDYRRFKAYQISILLEKLIPSIRPFPVCSQASNHTCIRSYSSSNWEVNAHALSEMNWIASSN